MAQQVYLPACSPHCLINAASLNTSFSVIGLTRLGIKPESTAPEADAHTTWPSELVRHQTISFGLRKVSRWQANPTRARYSAIALLSQDNAVKNASLQLL